MKRALRNALVVGIGASSARANFEFPLSQVRSIDGKETNGGKAGSQLVRVSRPNYPGDGSGDEIESVGLPNARSLSTACFSQSESEPSKVGLTDMVWQFGQFLE